MFDRESISASLLTSIAAITLAIIILLTSGWSVASALFISSNGVQNPGDLIARLVSEHEEEMAQYQARFDGRSAFFRPPSARPAPPPPPPPPPPPRVEEPAEEEPVEPPPPPPPPPAPVPDAYEGPGVLYVLGDLVVFRSSTPGVPGKRIRIGQERNGVDVVSVDPPRSVRLGFQPDGFDRAEFDVPIFDWSMPGLASSDTSASTTIKGLIAVDGDMDVRTQELYERMAGGTDPATAPTPPRSTGARQATPPRSPSGAAPPSRGRATPPARGRGR